MAEIKDRTGETRKTKHNQTMTIIKYNNCHDIDVQFDDGVIIKNTDYHNFKKQIRINTFETNSSSIHTLQVSKELMENCKLTIKDDGYIHIDLDQYYGRDFEEYKTQEDKLKYICTWMYIYYGNDIEQMYDGYEWEEFENEFCNYVNNHLNPNQRSYHCVGIKIDKIEPKYDYGSAGDFLDHQSCPYGSHDTSGFAFEFYDTDMLVNFIFNPYLWLQTDSD